MTDPRPAPRRTPLVARRPRPVAVAFAVVALAVPGALAGCSGSGGDSAGGGQTITPETNPASCESVEPGLVVDRSLAVVYFDTESVCPGWVTVEQGTPVTFTNRDSADHTVVITATQMPDSAEIARFTIPAGASQPLDTRDVARMGFSTDALPGFRGTVEVVAPGGATEH